MRSLSAALAALWFAYQALAFTPPGVYLNDGASGGIDGEPIGVAITWTARTLFAGLALLSLALIDWAWVIRRDRELRGD